MFEDYVKVKEHKERRLEELLLKSGGDSKQSSWK